ncbi:MAG TPA: TadE/TadG family type IV pilus assembly protein [Candidatus Limnocylindrales bacterium]|nr:TadE/TadG family type IV pilus assembly protein [Candidatus Limnocylindrales bacterium]
MYSAIWRDATARRRGSTSGTTIVPDVRASTIRRGHRRWSRIDGQALVEFSLVIPLFLVMLLGVIEFSLVFNAQLTINFATREAALTGAEAGNATGADCAILRSVEDAMSPPTNADQIARVVIYRSDTVGNAYPVGAPQQNLYNRGGSKPCPRPGNPSATVSFTLVGSEGFPETTRCNTIAGCGSGRPLDHIGVELTYIYSWHTPLASMTGLGGTGYVMVKSNAMRMEPVL